MLIVDRRLLGERPIQICLLELAYAGWITVEHQRLGHLTIRLEQQTRGPRPVPLIPIH